MRYLVVILFCIISFSSQAFEDSPEDPEKTSKKHSWGGGFGSGAILNDDADSLTLGSLFYEYHLDTNFSFNTKFFTGSTSGDSVDDHTNSSTGLQLSLKARANFYNMSVYARAGANLYDTGNNSRGQDNSGLGYVGAAGLEYLSDNGLILGFEFEYYTAGSIDVFGGNVFVGTRF